MRRSWSPKGTLRWRPTPRPSGWLFDAVLLDLTIRAGMGGKETMEALHRLDPEVRGIVMSGYTVDPALLEPGPHGFQDVLAKAL